VTPAPGGEGGGRQVVAPSAEVVDDLAVEALAAVDHGEEREQGRSAVELGDEPAELLRPPDKD
jgi:hypothetical protein